ncbi:MAG: hypothetical protein CMP23_17870 [Rickettsiales bacterium]|nr:hypothetical protein [Rickettsiales bacterium]
MALQHDLNLVNPHFAVLDVAAQQPGYILMAAVNQDQSFSCRILGMICMATVRASLCLLGL